MFFPDIMLGDGGQITINEMEMMRMLIVSNLRTLILKNQNDLDRFGAFDLLLFVIR